MARRPRTSIDVDVDATEAQSELKELSERFRREGERIDAVFGSRVGRSIDGVSSRLGALGKAVEGLGPARTLALGLAAGVTAVGAAAALATREAIQFTSVVQSQIRETRQLAENLGVSVTEFSALERVAQRYGATAEDVADVIKDLSVRAIENEKEFTELGISIRDTNGQLLQGIPLFLRVADGIRSKTNATEQAAAADILASDAGVRLIEVLRLGSDAIQRQTADVREAGAALDEYALRMNEEWTKATNRLTQETDSLSTTIATLLTPGVVFMSEVMSRAAADTTRLAREMGGLTAEAEKLTRAGEAAARLSLDDTIWGPFGPMVRGIRALAGRAGIGSAAVRAESLWEDYGPPALPDQLRAPAPAAGAVQGLRPPSAPATPPRPRGQRSAGLRDPAMAANDLGRMAPEGIQDDLARMAPDRLESLAETMAAERDLVRDHQAELVEIDRAGTAARAQSARELAQLRTQAELQAASDILGAAGSLASSIGEIEANLAGESGRRSEELFYVQQGISAAQAGVNTALAITRALAELGPIAGPIAAGVMAAAGAAQVAAILTASPGSPPRVSGSVSVPRVPARASVPESPRFGPGTAPGDGIAPVVVNVAFNGPVDSRRAAREIRDLVRAS